MLLQSAPVLPETLDNNNTVEICLNSRYSFHQGYSNTTNASTNQVIANALWATACAPLIAKERIIYVSLADNLYRYKFKNGSHNLEVHLTGNKRTESVAAFEIGVATDPEEAVEDAGAALHWAQLASVAFWKSEKPACCPKDSATTAANKAWSPASKLHLVNCYGLAGSVAGLKTTLAAVSSDKSLSDPVISGGKVSLETAMKEPLFGTSFTDMDVTAAEISQILWAAYGCTPHSIGSTACNTVASWNAKYFISGKIYLMSKSGVQKFHIHKTVSDLSSKEHRLESLSKDDSRSKLRTALSRLPQTAPVYIVFCGTDAVREQLIEAGYCGSSALLQTTALGLQGHYCGQLTQAERNAIQQACGIASADVPLLVFSAGHAAGTRIGSGGYRPSVATLQLSATPNPFRHFTRITSSAFTNGTTTIRIHDGLGKLVRTLVPPHSDSFIWDGRDHRGNAVPPGMYIGVISDNGFDRGIAIRKL